MLWLKKVRFDDVVTEPFIFDVTFSYRSADFSHCRTLCMDDEEKRSMWKAMAYRLVSRSVVIFAVIFYAA